MCFSLEEIPTREYSFKEWNCYTLAVWIRNYFGLQPLPDYLWAMQEFDEETKPVEFLENQFLLHATERKDTIQDFDLVILDFGKNHIALGTYVEELVYCISKHGIIALPPERLSLQIKTIWIYS